METWRGYSSLCLFQKRNNGGGGAFFIIGLGAGTFLGLWRIFARIFPNFPEKCFVQLFPTNFLHKDHYDLFWCGLQNRSSCVFLQTLGTVFWSQATLGTIFTRIIRDVAKIFSKSKLLGVCLHPQPPPPTPLIFITAS